MKVRERVLDAILHHPGSTQLQLSKLVFGEIGYPSRVNHVCRYLTTQGMIECRGRGGNSHPYRYYPIGMSRPTEPGETVEEGELDSLLKFKTRLAIEIGVYESEINNVLNVIRRRDVDGLSKVKFPSIKDISVTLSLLRSTNRKLSLLSRIAE